VSNENSYFAVGLQFR